MSELLLMVVQFRKCTSFHCHKHLSRVNKQTSVSSSQQKQGNQIKILSCYLAKNDNIYN